MSVSRALVFAGLKAALQFESGTRVLPKGYDCVPA